MTDDKRGKYGEVLKQMFDAIIERYMAEFKLDPTQARALAECAMSTIQEHGQGSAIYVAKGHLWHISEKHRRIYRRFTGNNHGQLAREFGMTERQIYTVVERVGREEFEKKQCKLFGE